MNKNFSEWFKIPLAGQAGPFPSLLPSHERATNRRNAETAAVPFRSLMHSFLSPLQLCRDDAELTCYSYSSSSPAAEKEAQKDINLHFRHILNVSLSHSLASDATFCSSTEERRRRPRRIYPVDVGLLLQRPGLFRGGRRRRRAPQPSPTQQALPQRP